MSEEEQIWGRDVDEEVEVEVEAEVEGWEAEEAEFESTRRPGYKF